MKYVHQGGGKLTLGENQNEENFMTMAEAQKVLVNNFIKKGLQPSVKDLQLSLYGNRFMKDSAYQKGFAYRAMTQGRHKARKRIYDDLSSPNYLSELKQIYFEQYDKLEDVEKDDSYKRYCDRILDNITIGADDKEALLETAREHALWYKQKIWKLAEEFIPFMIPVSKKRPVRWHLVDDFHEISIWDEDLAKHFIRSAGTVLGRMYHHRERLQDGRPVNDLLTQSSSLLAGIEDGTSWKCVNCTANNPANVDKCGVCHFPRKITHAGEQDITLSYVRYLPAYQ